MSHFLQQFYTENYEIIRPFINHYKPVVDIWVDPYGGQGHLLRFFDKDKTLCIDIDDECKPDIVSDSFKNLSFIPNCAVITNPPYAYRHILQKRDANLYEHVTQSGFVDLYEYAIFNVIRQMKFPPIFAILPENFIASRQTKLRKEYYSHIKAIQIHPKSTSNVTSQPTICVYLTPDTHKESDLWLGDKLVGKVYIGPNGITPSGLLENLSYVDFGLKKWQTKSQRNTSILLQAIDGGTLTNQIKLMRVYDKFNTKIFKNKDTDRAYIQIVPRIPLNEAQINTLIDRFNTYIKNWRDVTYGLGLTSFRNNTIDFRRKRIDFKLARLIIDNLTHEVIRTR